MQTYSFGDVRLDRRADIITEQIVATGSLVPRRFGGGRKGELAAGRFLDSPKVTPEAILQTHIDRTAAAARGRRRIVAIQDTTEVNFSGRDRSRKGLGPGADGKAKGFFKLAALGLTAAVRILQLVDARDGCDRPATDAIDAKLIEPAAAIGKTLEGKTKRQQNPHAKGTLGWLSWIAARLGGWNCYYKKPGPKTMAIGWRQLAAMIAGFVIAMPDLAVYGADV